MRKPVVLFLAALFLVIGAVVTAQADVPPIINYQGFLTLPSGQGVNGQRDFRFSVWTDSTGGTQEWGHEAHLCVTVVKGVFSVRLGDAGMPLLETVFEGPDRWLEIWVRACDDEPTWDAIDHRLAPRVRLSTVPYAFRVATVDSATGGTIKGDVEIKDGRLGIGTATPSAKLDVEVTSGGAATFGHSTNTATGNYAVAIGSENLAGGNSSFAVGSGNEATGYASVAMGQVNTAAGDHSAAFLWNNYVSGDNSFAIGANNSVEGHYSGAIGRDLAIAPTGGASHVVGRGASGTIRLTNSIPNSFMVGYLSDIPTFFVGSGDGVGTTGRVGIGRSDPQNKLDVDGTVEMTGFKMSTSPSLNHVLTSDGAGVGTWQDPASFDFDDGDWTFDSPPNINVLFTMEEWGIARKGNTLFGIHDSTHTNFGVADTTGRDGQDVKYATVSGGFENAASGEAATVGGGHGNSAIGNSATVPGGSSNTAAGEYSFAAGRKAKANHSGSFVWADGTGTAFTSTAANQFLIRASGGVGIGTNNPQAKLVVYDDSLPALFVESDNPSPGASGYFAVATVDGLWSHQAMAGDVILSTGCGASGNLIIQNRSWDDSVAIIFSHGPCNSDSEKMRIQRNGNVGIGVTDPSEILDVLGTARLRTMPSGTGTNVVVDGNGVLTKENSSRRYKTNIRELDVDAEKVFELNPVRFQWKSTGDEDIGLIAEEVDEVISDLVIYDSDGRPEAVKYDRVAIYLLEVLKEQQREIDELKATVDRLVEDQLAVRE